MMEYSSLMKIWFQVIEEDGCQQIADEQGTALLLGLAKLRDRFQVVGDVRGKGLMLGMEMVADKVSEALETIN